MGALHFLNACNSNFFKDGCLFADTKTTAIHRKLMPAAKETVVLIDGRAAIAPATTDASVCTAELFYGSDVVIQARGIGACVVWFFDGGALVDRLTFTIGEPTRIRGATEDALLLDTLIVPLTPHEFQPVTFGLRAFADDGDELVVDTAFTMSVADTSVAELIDFFAGTPLPTVGGTIGTLEPHAAGETALDVMHPGTDLLQLPISVQ